MHTTLFWLSQKNTATSVSVLTETAAADCKNSGFLMMPFLFSSDTKRINGSSHIHFLVSINSM